jgi:hypothetical protein
MISGSERRFFRRREESREKWEQDKRKSGVTVLARKKWR